MNFMLVQHRRIRTLVGWPGDVSPLVIRPSAPRRGLVAIVSLFEAPRLFLSSREYAFLTAAYALVRVQSFQHKLGARDLDFLGVFRLDFQRPQFVQQSLD